MKADLTQRLRAGAEILLQCPETVRLKRDHAPMEANLYRRADEANEAADEIERLFRLIDRAADDMSGLQSENRRLRSLCGLPATGKLPEMES